MPTTRKRHSITETDEVESALRSLRERGVRIDFGELVIRGAASLREELEVHDAAAARRRELRRRFLERTREARGFDLDAALEAREQGWTHPE